MDSSWGSGRPVLFDLPHLLLLYDEHVTMQVELNSKYVRLKVDEETLAMSSERVPTELYHMLPREVGYLSTGEVDKWRSFGSLCSEVL